MILGGGGRGQGGESGIPRILADPREGGKGLRGGGGGSFEAPEGGGGVLGGLETGLRRQTPSIKTVHLT